MWRPACSTQGAEVDRQYFKKAHGPVTLQAHGDRSSLGELRGIHASIVLGARAVRGGSHRARSADRASSAACDARRAERAGLKRCPGPDLAAGMP